MPLNKYIIFISTILFFSCQKNNQFTSIAENLSPFTSVELNSAFNIYLSEDSVFEIEIEGYERNVESIDFSVTDSVLSIRNNVNFKFTTPTKNKIDIYIKSKPLKQVSANETCNIKTITPITSASFGLILKSKSNRANLELNSGTFWYWNNFPCGGLITLNGQSKVLKLWNYALIKIDAQNLIVERAEIANHSKSDIDIHVTDKLEYSISNVGNIVLHNTPKEIIKNEVTSSGKLIFE
ncbi:MAG: DUF2807 domain-containing protein [Salinivirgaceae bacterium]|jgi:hypothetical protein|nr:DUF2807 domain-containing protein [Salinivirgaceae bacterium]